MSKEDIKKIEEKASDILQPILEELEDSTKERYVKANKAIRDALKEVDPNHEMTYEESLYMVQYFHRKMTSGLIRVMNEHMLNGIPGDQKFVGDFIDESLARQGFPRRK